MVHNRLRNIKNATIDKISSSSPSCALDIEDTNAFNVCDFPSRSILSALQIKICKPVNVAVIFVSYHAHASVYLKLFYHQLYSESFKMKLQEKSPYVKIEIHFTSIFAFTPSQKKSSSAQRPVLTMKMIKKSLPPKDSQIKLYYETYNIDKT